MRVSGGFNIFLHGSRRVTNCCFKPIIAFAAACAVALAVFGCMPAASTAEPDPWEGDSSVVIEKSPFFEVSSLPVSEEGMRLYRLAITSETPLVLQIAFDGKTHAVLSDQDGNAVVGADGYPVDVSLNPDVARESGTYSVSCGTLGEGLYTVSLSGGENAGIGFLAQRFRDVPADAWYFTEGYLDYAVDHGILRTLTNACFAPSEVMARADIVDALYTIERGGSAKIPAYDESAAPFSDMPLSTKSAAKLAWAADAGIARAESGNVFRAESIATREEAAMLIARYAEFAGADMSVQPDGALSGISDADAVSEDARDALAWCVDRGVLRTNGAAVNPRVAISFGEASQVFTVLARDVLGKGDHF